MEPAFTRVNEYVFDPKAYAWSLPSGWSCPAARACLAKADRETGALTNGKDQEYRCYSAVTERFPSVRERVWANFDAVKGKSPAEVARVLWCLPDHVRRVRIHPAGDFFSQDYFDGWLRFARQRPHVRFWAFTKSLDYWINRIDVIPPNLILQASWGGRHDHLIDEYGLKSARVVYSREEAADLGLEIDDGDRLAAFGTASFALLENFGVAEPVDRAPVVTPDRPTFKPNPLPPRSRCPTPPPPSPSTGRSSTSTPATSRPTPTTPATATSAP